MQLSMVLWSVWGLLVLVFVVLRIYTMGLNRNEDDQLLLHEGVSHVRAEQEVVMARLHKVEPINKTLLWLVIGMSLVIVAYYVVDVIQQFK
jgi:hypothetical protein